MKSILLFGLCITLSLVLIFGSVFSSSPDVLAVDMGGTMDGGSGNDGNNMPPPEDAPATTDALTAGGGSDNDDDEDDNDDNSGGSQDDDKDDNDKDDDNDNEPAIPKDAPATSDALTAKKLECPPGQEVALFSTTCEPAGGGSDSTQGTTSAATVCPPSATPSSYGITDQLAVRSTVWEFNHNYGYDIKTERQDNQQTLLHQAATPNNPPVTANDLLTNPGLRAICTGKQVSVTNPDGTKITYSYRTGKVAHVWVFDKGSGAWTWNYFDDVTGKLKAEYKFTGHGSTRYQYDPNGRLEESWASGSGYFTKNIYDPQTGKLKETMSERQDQTGWTTKTTFDANGKLIKQTKEPPEWAKQLWPTQ